MSTTGAGRSAFHQYFVDLYDLIETLLRGLEATIFSPSGMIVGSRARPLLGLSKVVPKPVSGVASR